jgi:hypothetical protein
MNRHDYKHLKLGYEYRENNCTTYWKNMAILSSQHSMKMFVEFTIVDFVRGYEHDQK